MRVTITLENTVLGPRPKLTPVRVDVDGQVTPAMLDELKAIVARVQQVNAAPSPEVAELLRQIDEGRREMRELFDGTTKLIEANNRLLERIVAGSR